MIEKHAAFLRDLAERLWEIPADCGVDQGDVDRLREIAGLIDDPCIDKREPGEPMFVLLARDSAAPLTMEFWSRERHSEIFIEGKRPNTDQERAHIVNVRDLVDEFRAWRKANRPERTT